MKYHRSEPIRHVGALPTMGADRYGSSIAVAHRGTEYSYETLEDRSNRVANVLAGDGIRAGDRVALYAENSLLFVETLFGVAKAGAVTVPLNTRMAPDRLRYVLEDADATALVASEAFADDAEALSNAVETVYTPADDDAREYDLRGASSEFEPLERAFDDVVLQCYTSGTTGDPKGVLTTHENVLTTVQSYLSFGGADPERDVALCVLPLFHMYGLSVVLLASLYAGRSVVLERATDPARLLEAITEYGVTNFSAVPVIYAEMVAELESAPSEYDVSSIERLGCGAAPLADDTRRRIELAFDTPLLEGWGMTETTPAGTRSTVYGPKKGAGCIGYPLPKIEIKLVDPESRETRVPTAVVDPKSPRSFESFGIDPDDDEQVTGEIAVRGPQVFEGYHGRPELTRASFDDDGFFYTDDIARIDPDGALWMIDRADDMLIVGGENVYPAAVEDALFEHPDVRAAAVVGAPHETKGEAPVAFVVPEPNAELTERELREFSLDHVASYAHPRRVFFLEELPRSGTRKVQRFKLEAELDECLDGPLRSSDRL